MARSGAVRVSTADSEFAEIIGWYQDLLERAYPPVDLEWEPVKVGPTWQYDNGWVLPQFTLGWRVLAWCGVWLRDKRGQPWQFTPEQARFVLWFFALDPDTGDFLYHSAVLQRLKGWGKDPLAAALAVAGMFAEVTFDHWNGDTPVGRDEPQAWVQLIAVSQEQTQNTMKLFPSLISPESRKFYGIQVGKLNVWGLGDTRQIQSVTNNPLSIEGKRPTLVVRNETQNWNSSNGGHEMAGAIEGNAAKSEDGAARMLDICNAFRPGDDSVGQRTREAWDATQGEDALQDYGLLYDSLEAPPDAPLSVEAAPAVVNAIRGDATWLSTKRIVASIMNPTNSASESRRKWYNQITAAEDARFDPNHVKLSEGDEQLQPGDKVVLFGDGSKSDDATGIVATRISDGLTQTLHVQQPKKGRVVDRGAVDLAVTNAFDTYDVVAFWFDPSHAKDDESTDGDNSFWMPLCDEWMSRYGRRLKHWAVKSGGKRHAIAWDMSLTINQGLFVPAVERLETDMVAGEFRFARSAWLRQHLINARRHPGRFGVSMRKDGRESAKKIDLAVCAAGARMLWRQVELAKVGTTKGAPSQGRAIVLR